MTPIRWITIGFALCLGLIGLGMIAYSFMVKPEPAVLAKPAPELRDAQKSKDDCKAGIATYSDRVKKNLGLDPDVVRDGEKKVVAATKIAGDEHPHTVTAIYDKSSGEVTQYVRRDPLPILSLINQIEIGAAYGIKHSEGTVVRIDGQWDLLQVKALKAGLYGQADSDGTGMIGVRVHIRF